MSDCKCGFGASIPGFGTPGATFIPKVTETDEAVKLSWDNNRGLPNPDPVLIPRGKDGLSAYEVAKANGFEGTEQEWLESLEGPVGPVGPQGEAGPVGPAGGNGADGAPGKSAYEYAKDGGYTGTQEEFATKLAAESVPAPVSAQPGQLLVVEEVDTAGKITKVAPMDRTHWKEVGSAAFDGELTGREYVEVDTGMYFVKMSSEILDVNDLIGRTVTVHDNLAGTDTEIVLTAENVIDLSAEGMPAVGALIPVNNYDTTLQIMFLREDLNAEGFALTAGVHFSKDVADGVDLYVKSLSGLENVTYHKIPTEYLPETDVKIPYIDLVALGVPAVDVGANKSLENLAVAQAVFAAMEEFERAVLNFVYRGPSGNEKTARVVCDVINIGTQDSTSICETCGHFYNGYSDFSVYIAAVFIPGNVGVLTMHIEPNFAQNGNKKGVVLKSDNGTLFSLNVSDEGVVTAEELYSLI